MGAIVSVGQVTALFDDGQRVTIRMDVTSLVGPGASKEFTDEDVERIEAELARRGHARGRRQIQALEAQAPRHFKVLLKGSAVENMPALPLAPPIPRDRSERVARHRSLLSIARLLLPRGARDAAFDEWVDELECAAAVGLPLARRTASILLRALPREAWTSRRPVRARGRGD
jgi:hypothetical protein